MHWFLSKVYATPYFILKEKCTQQQQRQQHHREKFPKLKEKLVQYFLFQVLRSVLSDVQIQHKLCFSYPISPIGTHHRSLLQELFTNKMIGRRERERYVPLSSWVSAVLGQKNRADRCGDMRTRGTSQLQQHLRYPQYSVLVTLIMGHNANPVRQLVKF